MIFLLFLLPISLFASDFSANMTLSNDEISTVQPLNVNLQLKYPSGYSPDLDAIRDNLLTYSGFGTAPFTLEKEEISLPKLTFTLNPQTTGDFSLSFYAIPFTNDKGETVEVISPILPVQITEDFIDTDYLGTLAPFLDYSPQLPVRLSPSNRYQLIDSKDVQKRLRQKNLELFKERRISWGEILLFVGTVALLAFAYFRKPKIPKKTKEQRLKEAKDKALSALNSLEVQDGYFDEYTAIIRTYISECYNLKMKTLTTQEFLQEITENPIFKEDTSTLLTDFFKMADQVKFAQLSPTATDYTKARASVENFIEITSSRLISKQI